KLKTACCYHESTTPRVCMFHLPNPSVFAAAARPDLGNLETEGEGRNADWRQICNSLNFALRKQVARRQHAARKNKLAVCLGCCFQTDRDFDLLSARYQKP